jgi:2-hydroxychromene-2-carboxylate isomerase
MAATDKRSAGDAPSRSIGAVMDEAKTIVVYTDYKSPYAYLAKDLIYRLEDEFRVRLDWLPYTLDIPSYLGSARLDERGEVVESERSPHQWRRVRYSYMDCRRQARKRGLVILGTRKICDSSIAAIGMLWAKRQGAAAFRTYHERVERLAARPRYEDARVVATVLAETGADATGFNDFLAGWPARTRRDPRGGGNGRRLRRADAPRRRRTLLGTRAPA